MKFTDEQVKSLSAPLDKKHVKTRQQAGQSLSYVEGWHVIAEANRIFGFGEWIRQTLEMKCVHEGERPDGKASVTYMARVRIAVGTGDDQIFRDGTGTGQGIAKSVGDAHESAMKEAETDAMKRALMTFGNPFGLALYDKAQTAVCDAEQDARSTYKRLRDQISGVANVQALDTLMHTSADAINSLPEAGRDELNALASKRREALERKAE